MLNITLIQEAGDVQRDEKELLPLDLEVHVINSKTNQGNINGNM